jgi:hypothetical protein
MSRMELVTVEDCFLIEGRGVAVIPDFSVPDGWKDRTETVLVTKPDGQHYKAVAQFSLTHYRLLDPKSAMDRRWRIVLLLQSKQKDDLPAGSKVFVSHEVTDLLLPKAVD